MTINCKIHGVPHTFDFLVDTQADISILKQSSIRVSSTLNKSRIIEIKGITHDSLRSLGSMDIELLMDDEEISHEFHIVTDNFNIDCDGIIGKDFLAAYKCRIDYSNNTFSVHTAHSANVLKISNSLDGTTMTIPPRCEAIRQFKIDSAEECVIDQLILAPGVYTSRTIVHPKNSFIRVINTTNVPQKVSNTIHNFEPLANFHCYRADVVDVANARTNKLKDIASKRTPQQYRQKLNELIDEFSDVFALPEDKMSVNNFYSQSLRTSNDSPTYIKNYRTPYTARAEIRRQVDKLLENDLIEPCASSYNSPLILVPKKSTDGNPKWRMCLDYRSVNKKLIADKFPLPRIDDILDNLGRATVFSVLDLFNGFHQIPIEKDSRDITAFSTEQGSFRWKVLPFGLNVSPNSFSRMMHLAFSGISAEKLFVYMDDIIVIGKSERDHLNNLRETFMRCRNRNLKINPDKCQFFKTEVLFLGHVCTPEGIRPDPSKFDSISNYPTPQDADAVRRFVALANYYRKFIPNFSVISIPLNRLTKKNAQFHWNREQEKAFAEIKNILTNPNILAYPDYSKQFVLTVDASKSGCGAVLSQNDLPIAFASKSFNRAEQNKATIEQELIAVHWAIKHFKHYLYGTEFLIRSDHRPLVYLYNLKETSAKLTRLRLELAEFSFSIEHIKGKENVVADALSRIHIDDIRTKAKRDDDLNELNIRVTTRSMTRRQQATEQKSVNENIDQGVIEPKVAHEMSKDETKGIPIIHTRIAESTRAPKHYVISVHQKYRCSVELGNFAIPFIQETLFAQQLFSQLEKLANELGINKLKIFTDEILFEEISINNFKDLGARTLKNLRIRLANPKRKVANVEEQMNLIQKYHKDPLNGGHCGVKKLLHKLRANYTWKNMNRQIQKYVESCRQCQLNKPKVKTVEPLVATDTPQRPFDKVSIDTIGPLTKSYKDNKYALTMICELSKYLIVAPIANKEANTVAKAMFENLVLIHGPIKLLISDQGSEYVNAIMRQLCEYVGISHKTSTAYHHETLGTVERSHRTFNEYLRTYLSDDADWETCLKYFAYCYNTSYHTSFDFKFTPFELVFGRKSNLPEFLLNDRIDPLYNVESFAKEAKYRLQTTAKAAKQLLEKNKLRVKTTYDLNLNPIKIRLNDHVMVRDETSHKHESKFKGPYLVIGIEEPNVTILDEKTRKTRTVHKNNVNIFIK